MRRILSRVVNEDLLPRDAVHQSPYIADMGRGRHRHATV